jgi:hypothetical protein
VLTIGKSWSNHVWSFIILENASWPLNRDGNYVRAHCHWCGGDGIYTVTRTSKLDGRSYTDHVCESHARWWQPTGEEATTS